MGDGNIWRRNHETTSVESDVTRALSVHMCGVSPSFYTVKEKHSYLFAIGEQTTSTFRNTCSSDSQP